MRSCALCFRRTRTRLVGWFALQRFRLAEHSMRRERRRWLCCLESAFVRPGHPGVRSLNELERSVAQNLSGTKSGIRTCNYNAACTVGLIATRDRAYL